MTVQINGTTGIDAVQAGTIQSDDFAEGRRFKIKSLDC